VKEKTIKAVELVIGNINVKLRGFYSRGRLDEATSFYQQGYFHTPQYKRGWWDGKCHLLSGNKLPTGLLSAALKIFDENDTKYTLVDKRKSLTPKKKFKLPGIKLRYYQVDAVKAMLTNMRGVVKIPTGGGKTFVAAAAAKAII